MREKEYKYTHKHAHTYYVYVYNNLCKFYLPALFIIFICRVKRQQGRQEESPRMGQRVSGERERRRQEEAEEALADECGEYFNKTASWRYACNIRTNTRTHTHSHTDTHTHSRRAHTLC